MYYNLIVLTQIVQKGNIMIKSLRTQMNLKKVLKKYLKNRNWKYKYTYTSDLNNFLHWAVMTPMGIWLMLGFLRILILMN